MLWENKVIIKLKKAPKKKKKKQKTALLCKDIHTHQMLTLNFVLSFKISSILPIHCFNNATLFPWVDPFLLPTNELLFPLHLSNNRQIDGVSLRIKVVGNPQTLPKASNVEKSEKDIISLRRWITVSLMM